MKSPELTEFFSLLGKAKKEKKEEFDNLLKEADINLDVLTSTVVTGIKEAKVKQKKQKKKEAKLIEQLDSIIDVIENPKEVKDITEPAVTVGVPEDFDVSKLEIEDADDNPSFEIVDIIKPEPIKTPKISDTVAQAIKFIEETNIKEEIENSDETSVDDLKGEIKQVRDILYKVLSHGPGSGEVNLLKLDDVDEDTAKVDGKFLKYDSSSGKFVGGDASGSTDNIAYTGIVTAAQFSGYSHLIAPYGSTTTITVKVASKTSAHRYYNQGSGNGYVLDNVEAPFLTLTPGRTYRFDVSDSSNSGHPFRFYYDLDKTTQYTTGVTVGSGYVDLEVTDTTPTVLHYQCSSHGNMGNSIQVNSNVVDTPSGGTVRGTLTATAFSGPLTGNVTGNLTGDVTGDLTGDVTGDITSSGNSQFTNRLQLKSTDGTPSRLDFYCESSNAHYLRLQAPPHSQFSGNPTVVLPNSAGTLLLSDGSGASLSNLNASNISSGTIGAARIPTLNQDTTGNAGSATILENARTIGGVSFNGSANIDLPGVNSAGNQNTTGTSAGLTGTPNITVGSIIASTGTFSGNVTIGGTLTYEDVTNIDSVGLVTARSGLIVGTGVTLSKDGDGFYTGIVTATTFVGNVTGNVSGSSGSTTGNAATATKLATARAIGGQSFDGTADITIDYGNIQNTPTIPSNNNQLTNGAGYITSSGTAALSQGLTGTPSIVVGVSTATKSHVGVDTGVYGEELVVTGDARVTGILTIGTGSITLDPTAKQLRGLEEIVIGIANTITIKQDAKGEIEFTDAVGTPKSVGIGTTVSINTSGIITATSFVGDVTGNVSGTSGSTTGNAATATKLATARTIAGVSFDGSSNISLNNNAITNGAGYITASGTAANATLAVSAQGLTGSPNITVTDVNAVDAIISGNLSVAGTITSLDQNDILATGIITASSGVDLGDPGIVTLSSNTLTTTSTSTDTVASVSATVNRSATFQVQVTRGTQYHMTTINMIHDGTQAFISEYGTIRTGQSLATFSADISGGNLRLRVTPTSTASTVFKLSKTTIKV